ncbi:MAG TPA: hypothetical protein VFZ34_06415 [Blastocatellia bacterium]|nr:hypothetical protein [Blastocatellia bacterium]
MIGPSVLGLIALSDLTNALSEIGVVVAKRGLSLGAVSDEIYGVVLVMAVATTLIAPPFLVRLFADEKPEEDTTLMPRSQIS